MFPAKNGDCFLIEIDEKVRLLIDAGYLDTYKNYLKPQLAQLAASGDQLDLCIITHIDADHIQGAVTGLFPENKSQANPNVIGIKEVWHNSYRHLDAAKNADTEHLDDSDEIVLESIEANGLETSESTLDSEISARQGSSLASMLKRYKYPWNSEFGSKAIIAPANISLGNDITCKILSPEADILKKLSAKWKSELRRLGFKGEFTDHAHFEEAYQSWVNSQKDDEGVTEDMSYSQAGTVREFLRTPFVQDKSVTNASSIAFILEFANKHLLFLADARPDIIVRQLTSLFPEASKLKPVWFDCIKVSHHGSFKNNSPELLQMTDSACYLFSTDGLSHNHPDVETIAHIISRESSRNTIRKLYFNYKTPAATVFDNADWKTEFGYEIIFSATDTSSTIIL
jgi:beta-lactamase superfamily II metal-dependent hydrolase